MERVPSKSSLKMFTYMLNLEFTPRRLAGDYKQNQTNLWSEKMGITFFGNRNECTAQFFKEFTAQDLLHGSSTQILLHKGFPHGSPAYF